MDKVIATILVLFAAFFIQYVWQLYRIPALEALLSDIDAPEALKEHSKEYDDPKIVKVTDGVYVALNYGIANSIMLVGPDGAVIVDTTENVDRARVIASEFKKICEKPIRAIIFTHHHTDHISGAQAFIEDPQNPPEVWAHPLMAKEVARIQKKAQIHLRRALFQFGYYLDEFLVNVGIGNRLALDFAKTAPVAPTRLLQGERQDVFIAGLKLTLIHIPGETSDQIAVWYDAKKILLPGDDIYKAFPNLYAIRGTTPRDVNDWVESLDKMAKLGAEYMVGSHGKPVQGKETITELLSIYKAGIQYVHDQTVRYMNKGLHPDEIALKVKLPADLASHPYLQEFYGTVPWSVKGIFIVYMGWFSGYAEELYPLAPSQRAEKMVRMMGKRQLLRAAADALEEGDYQWALELASHVHVHEAKKNANAIGIRKEAMRALASRQMTANGRNFYMTAMMEDAGLFPESPVKLAARSVPVGGIFQAMRSRLKAENLAGVDTVACFNFTDIEKTFSLHVHHSVLSIAEGQAANPACEVTLTTTEKTWKDIVLGEKSPVVAYMGGDIIIDGGVMAFKGFMDYFERD